MRCSGCGWSLDREDGLWRFAPGLEPSGFPAARREHLDELSRHHFWFPPRRRLVASRLSRWAPAGKGVAAIELGCGAGGLLPELAGRYRPVVGVDAYAESLAAARGRAPEAVLVQSDVCRVPLAAAQFGLVLALDVLEHVPAEAFLAEAARLASPRGRLVLSVPALPGLWSELDEVAGHRCRYRLDGLRAELAASGWRLLGWTHYQFLLLPLVWLSRRFAPLRRRRIERRPPAGLGRLLGLVNAFEVAVLGRLPLPWGSSIVAVAGRAA